MVAVVAISAAGVLATALPASATYLSGTKNCGSFIAYSFGTVTSPSSNYVIWDPPGAGPTSITMTVGSFSFNGSNSGGWYTSGNPGTLTGGAACRNYG